MKLVKTNEMLEGALYSDPKDGEVYEMIGRTTKRTFLRHVETKTNVVIEKSEDREFNDLNQHNHDKYCCSEHHLHVSPHLGCIFR